MNPPNLEVKRKKDKNGAYDGDPPVKLMPGGIVMNINQPKNLNVIHAKINADFYQKNKPKKLQ